MRICVLGAGIAGLSAAWLLTQAGHHVTVVDRAGAGTGASAGNGAQLSYSYVQPLADPSVWAQLPRLLLSPTSPLKLRPRLDPHQWRWALRFLAACTTARSRATTARLLVLAADSRAAFDDWRERHAVACDYAASGKLVLYRTEAGFAAARRQVDLQRHLGGPAQRAVDAAEALAIEPALAASGEPLAGAIHTPSDCAADCRRVCEALARLLRDAGATLRLQDTVTGFDGDRTRLRAVRTASDAIATDAVVLSLGTGSLPLARALGIDLPLYPLKGYSITVPLPAGARGPQVSVTDSSRKVVFARIGERLRVAGMAELVGDDTRIPQGRIDVLAAATRAVFPGCDPRGQLQPWTGMRPATPTGEPLVGRHPRGPANLLLNTGHGALGFTLAFGTARRVVAMLEAVR